MAAAAGAPGAMAGWTGCAAAAAAPAADAAASGGSAPGRGEAPVPPCGEECASTPPLPRPPLQQPLSALPELASQLHQSSLLLPGCLLHLAPPRLPPCRGSVLLLPQLWWVLPPRRVLRLPALGDLSPMHQDLTLPAQQATFANFCRRACSGRAERSGRSQARLEGAGAEPAKPAAARVPHLPASDSFPACSASGRAAPGLAVLLLLLPQPWHAPAGGSSGSAPLPAAAADCPPRRAYLVPCRLHQLAVSHGELQALHAQSNSSRVGVTTRREVPGAGQR